MGSHPLGSLGISLRRGRNIATLHIQQNRNILRNGPYDLSSIQGKIRYLSECLHSTGNGLKEGRIWFVAASDILRSLDKTSAECLQTLRSVLGQLLSMGVQTNAEKRMTLLDSSIKHIKELHRIVLFFLSEHRRSESFVG